MAAKPLRIDFFALTLVVIFISVSVFVILFGLMFGVRTLSPATVLSVLMGKDEGIDTILVWVLRLPRSLAAFSAGVGLSIAGYLLQTLTRNPLAGPGLTGTSAGAVTSIVICLTFLPWLSPIYLPFIGMVGGIAAALVTFWIARGSLLAGSPHNHMRPLHLALGGINVSLFLTSITTWIIVIHGAQIPSVLFWLAGGFQGRSWAAFYAMLPWIGVGALGVFSCHRIIGLMRLDDHSAASMGLNLTWWRPVILCLAVLPVAGIVPVAGPIAFIGLASPHLARLMRSTTALLTCCLAASIGGLITVSADIIARSIVPPREMPVGIIIALIAGPVFIWLVQQPRLKVA